MSSGSDRLMALHKRLRNLNARRSILNWFIIVGLILNIIAILGNYPTMLSVLAAGSVLTGVLYPKK